MKIKKTISFLLALSMLIGFNAYCVNAVSEYVTNGIEFAVAGDANFDGIVNIIDLVRMKKYSVDTSIQDKLYTMDLDSDSEVNAIDMSLLKRTLLGIDNSQEVTVNYGIGGTEE